MPTPTTTPTETPRLPDDHLDHVIPVTVDGVTELRPIREVAASYQLRAASTKRFEEANALKRELETHAAIVGDLRTGFTTSDRVALRRALTNLELPPETISALLDSPADDPAAEPEPPPSRSKPSRREQYDPNSNDDTPADNPLVAELYGVVQSLQTQVADLTRAHTNAKGLSRTRTERAQVESALAMDPALATLLEKSSNDPETREWYLGLATAAAREASARIPWGPKAIAQGIEAFKRRMKPLLDAAEAPPSTESTPYLGLGPANNPFGPLHQTAEPKKRLPITDPGYARNFASRFTDRLRKLARGR